MDLAVPPLRKLNFVPGVFRPPQRPDRNGDGEPAVEPHAAPQLVDLLGRGSAADLHLVGFRNAVLGGEDTVGKIAVVGEQQQAFGVVVEPSDG